MKSESAYFDEIQVCSLLSVVALMPTMQISHRCNVAEWSNEQLHLIAELSTLMNGNYSNQTTQSSTPIWNHSKLFDQFSYWNILLE